MDGRNGGFGDDGGESTRFIAHHEEERQLVGDRMRAVIVGKFGQGNMLCPRSRIDSTKNPKIGFYFLIDTLSFSISLGVISGGESKFIAEEFS